mgnify:CR=1 FL=1
MSSIDKRIVQMQFDNQGFEKGVSTTMKSLKNLNESLKMKNATNGLTEVHSGINKLTSLGMGALSSGVDAVSSRFNAMGIIAATALMNITNQAIATGKRITSALTVDPIMDGFNEYETKMNAIQTILTNTASKGTTLDDVKAALADLNEYSDKTIYNFADMTKNIGTFTAAGVDLDRSVTAIKGIANLAAGSGSSAAQASTAMYQLSQALASGKVNLQDWNSVVNAGMGGDLFKNALIDMAKQMGIFVDESKPFRETLKDDWLTSEVLIKTLEKFANDESLVKAATEIKTFTQLIDTMKESVGSGWATTWEYIIGDKDQATEFFTAVSDGFNGIIQPSTDARNAIFKAWNQNGGRAIFIEGLSNAVQGLGKVLSSIKGAWNEVFPPMTSMKLMDLTNKFRDLTEKFKISDETADKIKTTFKGLFEIIPLVKDAVKALIDGISPMGKLFDGIGTNLLDAGASIGQFFTDLRQSASDMGFFETISSNIKRAFESVGSFLLSLKDKISTLMGYLADLDFSSFFGAIMSGFNEIKKFLEPVIESLAEVIGTIDFGTVFDLIKAGSAVEMVKQVKNMTGEVADVAESAKGIIGSFKGFGKQIKDVLMTAKDALEAYQKDLNAKTLIKLAAAIALLAGSLLLVSSIDLNSMAGGLLGIGVLFAELIGAFAIMEKFDLLSGPVKMYAFGSLMKSMAIAIGILALALKHLSDLSPKQLMTGILGLSSAMLIAVSAVKMMGKSSGKIISSSVGLLIFASALHVMASALEKIGSIDADVLGAGLLAIGVLLGELALFMAGAKFGGLSITSATGVLILSAALLVLKEAVEGFGNMDPDAIIIGLAGIAGILAEIALFGAISAGGVTMIGLGIALNIIAASLIILADAVKSFGGMTWGEIGRGLIAMAGGLTVLGVASALISGVKMGVVGVGIGIMAVSIGLLGAALKSFGNMSWEEIGKGMVVLAGSLTILAIAMAAMTFGVVGAAAMVVVAGALAVLTPQLLMLSQMSLEGIGIALLGMAGAFTVLGLAGLLLTPVIPTLLGLAGAIALIGLGALACGAGLALVGAGLTTIGVAVGGSGLLIVEFLRQLIDLLPQIGTKWGEAMVNFAEAIGNGAPQIVESLTTLMSTILTAMGTIIPQVIQLGVDTVIGFANGVAQAVPALVDAGLRLILGVLEGIAANIQQIVETGIQCVINFMDGIANKLPAVIESGINLALTFIEGVADGLINNKERIGSAIQEVVYALVTTGVDNLKAGVSGFIEGGKELLQGAIDGIEEKWPAIEEAVKGAVEKAKQAASNLGSALWQAGVDLIQGFVDGIGSMGMSVVNKATEIAGGAVEAVKNFLGIHSPSRVFKEIGKFTVEGMVVGLDKYGYMAADSASDLASNVLNNVRNPLKNVSKILNDEIDVNPKITPVIDLSNVSEGTKLLSNMLADQDMQINARSGSIAGSVGKIQNRYDNSDVIAAVNGLKESLNNNGPSYTINGITYDDGSNVSAAVQTLVRAARIERRL